MFELEDVYGKSYKRRDIYSGDNESKKGFCARCVRKTRKELRLEMIKSNQEEISISKQYQLLRVGRSS